MDVGVHQDGLVHISELADQFVKDPADVVKAGDKLQVRVLSVDIDRKRISLSARSDAGARQERPAKNPSETSRSTPRKDKGNRNQGGGKPRKKENFSHNPFANLLRK